MSKDDFVYMILLLTSIGFGHFYQKIKSGDDKKLVGTFFGIFILFFTSGFYSLLVILTFVVCTLIIFKTNQRKCHLFTFAFMFTFLLFFRLITYFGFPAPTGHTNLIQMILTLKIVGLAFERNSILSKISSDPNTSLTQSEKSLVDINSLNMFHYCFSYIGLLTGPYFTYRTYYDSLYLPFISTDACTKETLNKFKVIPLYAGLFLICNYLWPLEYSFSDEFYNDRSWIYRLWYCWPRFFVFRMRIYTGIILSECVCTMAGLGSYPKKVDSKCGHGPSVDYEHLIGKHQELEYNFETIKNIDVWSTETCWTFREAMRSWNTCVQYWLAMYVYKRFPKKQFRTMATLGISAFWHGVLPGHYFCILAAPFYLPIDDLFTKLFRNDKTGNQLKIANIISWIMKFFAFSYMGISFQLQTIDRILKYYKSVYYFGYVFWAILYIIFLGLSKFQASKRKRTRNFDESTKKLK